MINRKKTAVRHYLNKLPAPLAQRYGHDGPYTADQVKRTVDDLNLSPQHIDYAYVLFCDGETLAALGIGETSQKDMLDFARQAVKPGPVTAAFISLVSGAVGRAPRPHSGIAIPGDPNNGHIDAGGSDGGDGAGGGDGGL